MSWKPTRKLCEPVMYDTLNLPLVWRLRSWRLAAARDRKFTPVESSVAAMMPAGRYGCGQKPHDSA